MSYIKLFEEWSQLNEAQIRVFAAGNPWKPEQVQKGKGYVDYKMTWPKFYEEAPKWLEEKIAVSVIVDDFIPNSETLGYNKKVVNLDKDEPIYRSEIDGTWDNKSLKLFTDEHPDYNESQFDLVEVDPSLKDRDGVYIQDKDGNEFCVHASRILDVQKGCSVRDGISSGTFWTFPSMESKRGRIVNYQAGIITVSFHYDRHTKQPSQDPKDILTFTLKEWRKEIAEKRIHPVDESKAHEFIDELFN